jgi:PKD domain
MNRNRISDIQKINAGHKLNVVSIFVGLLCATLADQTMGACDRSPIPSQIPINELGTGIYHPGSSLNSCTGNDTECDDPTNYPCQGGLYLLGSNQQPAGHLTEGLNRANTKIVPRDSWGNPTEPNDPNGKIVLLSMGMCNAALKFGSNDPNSFMKKVYPPNPAFRDKSLNTHLVIVNGAQAGAGALQWVDPDSLPWKTIYDPNDGTGRLHDASVTPEQVQVIWCEHALIFDNNLNHTPLCTIFPQHAYDLRNAMETTLQNIHTKFVNCQIVYISPRAFAYSVDFHNPEPKAYQTGFADKWVIMDQLLNRNNMGWTLVPWIAWGPYLWTDGANARSDGLQWLCNTTNSDVTSDFVHPSTNGINKVSNQLIAFFKTDPTSTPWFLRPNSPGASLSATITPQLPKSVPAGSPVSFSATATSQGNHPIVSYLWTFDDGESKWDSAFTRTFNVPGTYNIQFTAIDDVGNHIQKSGLLTVN